MMSFFWFSQAIRLFNHVGLMITLEEEEEELLSEPLKAANVEFISSIMDRGSFFQALGVILIVNALASFLLLIFSFYLLDDACLGFIC
jgi:hypothetical protein